MEVKDGDKKNKQKERKRKDEGRKRLDGGWVKVMFKLALGEPLPWKCFED